MTTPIYYYCIIYCIMCAGEGDDANARMDKLKLKAAQFQSFILITICVRSSLHFVCVYVNVVACSENFVGPRGSHLLC